MEYAKECYKDAAEYMRDEEKLSKGLGNIFSALSEFPKIL